VPALVSIFVCKAGIVTVLIVLMLPVFKLTSFLNLSISALLADIFDVLEAILVEFVNMSLFMFPISVCIEEIS
jgi:hypothetical protein